MKKSVIALALIGAFSGAAVAQSNVTMYGIVDVGYQYNDAPISITGTLPNAKVNSDTWNSINSGIQSGSRFGVRGTEALGGGLNALFTLEMGFNIDTGTLGQSNSANTRVFGRQAYAGLGGNWGKVVAGRIASFSSGTGDFDMVSRLDPFSTGFGLASMGNTFISANSLRVDNSIAYVSPTFSGFTGGLGYSTNINGGETAPQNTNVSAFMAGANWASGPFYVAVTYDSFNNTGSNPDQKNLQIGGTFDIASFRLHAAWANQTSIGVVPTANSTFLLLPAGFNYDANAYLLGVTWTMDAFKVFGSFQSSSADGKSVRVNNTTFNVDPDYTIWALGGTYNLSRRTNLYTAWASRNSNGTLQNAFNAKQFSLGVRHLF